MSILGWRSGPDEQADAETVLDCLRTEEIVTSSRDDIAGTEALPSSALGDIGHVRAELVQLRSLFESRLRYDETREAQFSQLYAELESYRRAESAGRMLRLARGVLLIIDQIEEGSATDTTEIAEDLLDCLAAEGIEPIDENTIESGRGFEQVVGFTDNSLGQVVRRGYRFGDVPLRPRQVLAPKAPTGGPR